MIFILGVAFIVIFLIGLAIGSHWSRIDGFFIIIEEGPNDARGVLDMCMDLDRIKSKKTIRLKICQSDKRTSDV